MAPVRDNPIVQAMLFAVLILILADMLFGIINACMHHEFSSKKLREGLMHKTGELALVLVGIIIDGLIFAGIDIGVNGPILGVMLTAIIVMEIGSLMEIAAKMNPELANMQVFKMLASVKENVKEAA
jgi:toxin secretion/phage lysis holin